MGLSIDEFKHLVQTALSPSPRPRRMASWLRFSITESLEVSWIVLCVSVYGWRVRSSMI